MKLTILARSLLFTCTCLHLWTTGFCCKRSCRQSSCCVNHWMQQGRDEKVTHGFQLISFLVSCYFPSPNCSVDCYSPGPLPCPSSALQLGWLSQMPVALLWPKTATWGTYMLSFLRNALLCFSFWSSLVFNGLCKETFTIGRQHLHFTSQHTFSPFNCIPLGDQVFTLYPALA